MDSNWACENYPLQIPSSASQQISRPSLGQPRAKSGLQDIPDYECIIMRAAREDIRRRHKPKRFSFKDMLHQNYIYSLFFTLPQKCIQDCTCAQANGLEI